MKPRLRCPLWLALCLVPLLYAPALGQDGPGSPGESQLSLEGRVIIQAPVIEQFGTSIRASEGVLFRESTKRIRATDAVYDTSTKTGVLRDVVFTTCSHAKPDYRIEAREIRLLPNDKLRANRVSVYLGRVKLITLPFLFARTTARRAGSFVFPRPSYDTDDGFGLSQEFQLLDSDRSRATADLTLMMKRGLRGEIRNEHGIDGDLRDFSGRFLTYESLRERALDVPGAPTGNPPRPEEVSLTRRARLRQFGRFSFKQRAYDVRKRSLRVDRQPELGITYIAPAISFTGTRLDPRLEIYPTLTASWGRFKEEPGTVGLTTRRSISAAIGANLLSLGEHAAVQPVLLYEASSYGSGDTYRTIGYAIDAARLFDSGASATLRYIRRDESGHTPFYFDGVDVFRQVQGALQLPVGRHIVGFVADLDLDARKTYDWEVLYGYHTDCLAGWVSWHSRLQRLSFDISISNF